MSQNIESRIQELRDEINRHNRLYYVEARTEIPDREFDQLLHELIDLENQHPELRTPDSPSQKVGGAPIEGFTSVPHRVPMLSIDNVFETSGIVDFDQRIRKLLDVESVDYTLEYKIDGVALAVIYEQGILVQALTRGDGQTGDDVTHNARTIGGIPLTLQSKNVPERLEVRGEAYIANSDFAILRAQQEESGGLVHANPRNSTAGALKLLDPALCAKRKVRFLTHGIGDVQGLNFETHMNYLEAIREYGLPTTPGIRLCHGIDEVLQQAEVMMAALHELDLEIDGLVIKVNNLALREELGNNSKSPRWVVAYKWERYEAETQIESISIQVGKTGTLTPVANLAPVEIAGTTVSRSSLHNRDEVERLGVKIGDWVIVEKAGKIIPHVVRVELERRSGEELSFEFPANCPECGTKVIQDEGGVYIRCPNPNCPARLRESIRFFASRQAMDIEGLGIKLIEQLIDAGLVKNLVDIYDLHQQQDRLLELERFGQKSAEKLLQGVENSKQQPVWRLLTGLNIRHVGVSNAQVLMSHFLSLEQISQATEEELAAIDEIGPVIAASVSDFFHSSYGQSLIQELKSRGVRVEEEREQTTANSTQVLQGKSIVVTGTLQQFTRQEIQDAIREHGGKAASSVSSKTDFVVAGENAGSKLAKAQSLNVSILSEAEFLKMISEYSS
ncbi:NAD-dependent DNA ligase LigA [Rubinisphaera italica]|uniref:DNA ligase n=1 Tax=Rubinisphaera italica TaxID=2527969 RepID=A0A5C5XI37_9PLAN|nr:NAD-dependent DNA ligase LigA [Rubinisphaera italica]TWT62767.1 DNA ligase [Rubinisphaera italica]